MADEKRFDQQLQPTLLQIGDEIMVNGRIFVLTEFKEYLKEPAQVVFKTPEELSLVDKRLRFPDTLTYAEASRGTVEGR